MKALAQTEDGLSYEDGVLTLKDGRRLAWRWWGDPDGIPVMRFQGMPSSRLMRVADSNVQLELGIRFLLADRPGYGGSTRKPGHGIADLADDIVQLLDKHGIHRVPVIGNSSGGPQALALAARYPDRVKAVTVVVGSAPMTPEEAAGLVELNAKGYIAKHEGWDHVFQLLSAARREMLMAKPAKQRQRHADVDEALRQGAEGWSDESFALRGDWDFDPSQIKASVVWWHGDDDRNAPLSAAQRAVARIPGAQLSVWHGEGHAAAGAHEREVIADLLERSK